MDKSTETPWPSYIETLAPFVDQADWIPAQLKTDPVLRSEFDNYLAFMNTWAYFTTVYQDAEYPDFFPFNSTCWPFGFANPDTAYLTTAIEDDGVYRITGHRGTVRILQFEIGSSTMQSWGYGEFGRSIHHYDVDRDATVQADGTFDVILSPERPEGYDGDWWELGKDGVFILVRQCSYDWLNEVDARLTIERLDRPALRPRRTPEENARRLDMMRTGLRNWVYEMLHWYDRVEKQCPPNEIKPTYVHDGGIWGQSYHQGVFDLADDECLVLEAAVPADCHYWMFHTCDTMMSSIDYIQRMTSLNGHQARLDNDGKFRAVISVTDPGSPNWLDTVGRTRGAISGRWWTPEAPDASVTLVKLAELRDHLPADTPWVSAEQRDREVRERRRGGQLRRRW